MAGLTSYDVAIVGGGFAGLSAAVRLAARGARVLVLEARGRLGGRATSFADRESGEHVDNGQHILLGCYTETLRFLDVIGASNRVRTQPALSLAMIDRDGRRSTLACPTLPAPIHLLAGLWDWDALDWADRLAVLRMAGPLRCAVRQLEAERDGRDAPTLVAASPGETVAAWLQRNGQTARLNEMLWEPLALAALNQPLDRAAAPVFTRVLAEAFGGHAQAASIVLPAVPLHDLYAEPAQRFIERRHGEVRTGAPAVVHIKQDRVTAVESGGQQWAVDAVVSAVPWFAIAGLFEGDTGVLRPLLARAHAMAASPILTVNLWFDRPVLDAPFIGLPGRAMQWAFERRDIVDAAASPLSHVSHVSLVASGASPLVGLTNAELIAMAHADLLEAVPAVRTSTLRRGMVIREPKATFSLAPGQPPRPWTETPVRGLFLAGDWIETGLPATIESAVRSGHRAADAV